MKNKFLAAVATCAFVATGVAAQAQDSPKEKERPAAAEKAQPKATEAPKAAQMERQEPKGQEHVKGQATPPGEAPKAAQSERKEAPKAAQTQPEKEAPKAAQSQERKEPMPLRATRGLARTSRIDRRTSEGRAGMPR